MNSISFSKRRIKVSSLAVSRIQWTFAVFQRSKCSPSRLKFSHVINEMKKMVDHWRLLRDEKAVKLMSSKDAKEITKRKDVSTFAFGTKRNRIYFVRFFILAVARYSSINIIFVLRFALVDVAVFRQTLLRF